MFRIDQDDRIVIFAHEGPLYPGEAVRFLNELRHHPDYTEGLPVLYDLRRTSLMPFDIPALKFCLEQALSHPELFARHAAMVAETSLEFGICRMWLSYTALESSLNRMLFRDFNQARDWLLSLRPGLTDCPAPG